MCRHGWDDAPNARDDDARDDAGHACRCGVEQAGGLPITWDNVYRPYMDYCLVISPRELLWRLSSPALRLSLLRSWGYLRSGSLSLRCHRQQGRRGSRGKGRARAMALPRPRVRGTKVGWGARGEEVGGRKRTIWSIGECVALAKAWISVVEDPYIGANQHID